MILGIDTSAGRCAVALVGHDARLIAERAAAMERGHAEALWPMVDVALAEAGAGYPDISRIAVCTGPGSFTGIRVGVAAARGLALGRGVPALGIDRFDALVAPQGPPTGPPGRAVAVALTGPRDTAFLRLYGPDRARIGADRQVARAELAGLAPADAVRVGDGWPGADPEAGLPSPATLARMALGLAAQPEPPAPYYLRGPGADPPRRAPPPRIG